MAAKPPGTSSAAAPSRVSRPFRSSSRSARAWRRSVSDGGVPPARATAVADRLRHQRPPAGALRRTDPARWRPSGAARRPVAARPGPAQRADGQERVVGQAARPDQVPQRVQQLPLGRLAGARRRRQPHAARPRGSPDRTTHRGPSRWPTIAAASQPIVERVGSRGVGGGVGSGPP